MGQPALRRCAYSTTSRLRCSRQISNVYSSGGINKRYPPVRQPQQKPAPATVPHPISLTGEEVGNQITETAAPVSVSAWVRFPETAQRSKPKRLHGPRKQCVSSSSLPTAYTERPGYRPPPWSDDEARRQPREPIDSSTPAARLSR